MTTQNADGGFGTMHLESETTNLVATVALSDKVRSLRVARDNRDILGAQLRASREATLAEWDRQHAADTAACNAFTAECAALEAEIKAAAEARFKATGDRHPAPGVTMKVMRQPKYDPAEALAWCKQHDHPEYVETRIRDREFKAAMREGFVQGIGEIVEIPDAQIDRDLSKALTLPVEGDTK